MITLLLLHVVFLPLAHACLATSPITMPVIPPCQECTAEYMTYTDYGAGAKEFDLAVVYEWNDCKELALVCVGLNANVEFNNAMGVVKDTDKDQTPGQVIIYLRCNAAGTAWEFDDHRAGLPIDNVECSIGN